MSQRVTDEVAFWDAKAVQPKRLLFRRNWYTQTNRMLWSHTFEALGDLAGKRVLFVGCGESGSIVKQMASRGGEIWCLDISAKSVECLMRHPFGDLAHRVHPVVGDAESMPFGTRSFDIAVGKAIVHHLDIGKFMAELARVCVADARLVFCEPLGTNPVIKLFRALTPSLRVPAEHPLVPEDLDTIGSYCGQLTARHFDCLTAFSFPLYFLGFMRLGRIAHRAFEAVDTALFHAVPPVRWLAWSVVLAGCLSSEGTESRRVYRQSQGRQTESCRQRGASGRRQAVSGLPAPGIQPDTTQPAEPKGPPQSGR